MSHHFPLMQLSQSVGFSVKPLAYQWAHRIGQGIFSDTVIAWEVTKDSDGIEFT